MSPDFTCSQANLIQFIFVLENAAPMANWIGNSFINLVVALIHNLVRIDGRKDVNGSEDCDSPQSCNSTFVLR